jgi:hypothetical protein
MAESDHPTDPTPCRGRAAAARQAYIAAVAARSNLSGRLAATTLLGDTRPTEAEFRIAN